MKHKILWMLLSCLLVASLVLASCAKEVVVVEEEEEEEAVVEEEEEEEEEEVVVPAVGEPQYGGTLTMLALRTYAMDSWELMDGYWTTPQWTSPYLERLLIGDVETYGMRGTGEYLFTGRENVPYRFLEGQLCESWEVSADKVVFHIRPGIMFTGNTHIGMEPREYTADDTVFNIQRYRESAIGKDAVYWVSDVYAEDKYTCVVEMSEYNANWCNELGWRDRAGQIAHEAVEAPGGAWEWKNQVGTGSFILTEYVEGSYAVYKRNPDYWGQTTINGKEYQTPFIDKLVWPLMSDVSTKVATLRTGTADILDMYDPSLVYEESLAQTSPELMKYKFLPGGIDLVALKCNSEYFSNREVRRAMMIGTDLRAIIKAILGEGDIHSFPINSNITGIYTPLEELPPSARELFEYDPVKAKQMIIDAGYPNGFSIELVCYMTADDQDRASMLKEQWAKIGVDCEITALDRAVAEHLRATHDYKDAFMWGTGNSTVPLHVSVGMSGKLYNIAEFSDPYFDKLYMDAEKSVDFDDMYALLKEACVYLTNEVAYIPLGSGKSLVWWWPWVKNYYGETEAAFCNYMPMINSLWIDQVMKANMGY